MLHTREELNNQNEDAYGEFVREKKIGRPRGQLHGRAAARRL